MVTQQDYLADNFWNKFDFSNGKIEYMETYLDEDMLQVEYPNKLLLDAGYYSVFSVLKLYGTATGKDLLQNTSAKHGTILRN